MNHLTFKKANYRLSLLFLALLFAACDDFLEKIPESSITKENFWSNETDANAGVIAIYDVLRYMYRSYVFRMDEIPSDDVKPGPDAPVPAEYYQMNNYTMDAMNPELMTTWEYHYFGIARANAAIENIPGIQMNTEKRDQFLAEAKFFRAFFYFKLVRYFGHVPLITYTFEDIKSLFVPRDDLGDIYDLIIADLEFAADNLTLDYPANQYGRVTKGAANTLLAKVWLTKASLPEIADRTNDFQNARQCIEKVIDSKAYSLEAKYADIFNVHRKSNELIFTWNALGGYGVGTGEGGEFTRSLLPRSFTGIVFSGEARAFFVPEQDMWNAYTFGAGDTRRDVNILEGNPSKFHKFLVVDGDTIFNSFQGMPLNVKVPYPHIWKYKDFRASFTGDDDCVFPILRYADVLLMYAEVINELEGPVQLACDNINAIRKRAKNKAVDEDGVPIFYLALNDYKPSDFSSKELFLEAVINERRLELAFEGHRRVDLIRWGKLVEVLRAKGITNIEDHHVILPLPQQELDANPRLYPQNPGYN